MTSTRFGRPVAAALALCFASICTPAKAIIYQVWLGGTVTSQAGDFEGYGSILGKYVAGVASVDPGRGATHDITSYSEVFSVADQAPGANAINPMFFYRPSMDDGLGLGFGSRNATLTFGTGRYDFISEWTQFYSDGVTPYAQYQIELSALVPGLLGRLESLRSATATSTDTLATFTYTNFLRPNRSYKITFAPTQLDILDPTVRSCGEMFPGEGDVCTGVAVPEPSTWAMMITGFAALGAILRRRHVQLALTA